MAFLTCLPYVPPLKIEAVLRRHDLLTALVKKEYEHNKRLVCQWKVGLCNFELKSCIYFLYRVLARQHILLLPALTAEVSRALTKIDGGRGGHARYFISHFN
jgi:hypothetical protein